MKKFLLFFPALFVPVVLLLMANSSGSPGGRTGSPGDNGNTCTGCHTGTANTVSGWITTNVPPSGFVAGQTYTITATGTHSGVVKFGFELTVEDNTGAKVGTLVITDPSRTKLVNANKAVTHTSGGTTPVGNSSTWSMNWVAPASVSGEVGIYAAFNAANGNGNNSGDVIYKTSIFISPAPPPAPTLVSIVPNTAEQGQTLNTTITGSNTTWTGSPSVSLRYSLNPLQVINATSVTVTSQTVLQAAFDIPFNASPGLWDLYVGTLSLQDAFTVVELIPSLVSIVPDMATQGETVTSTIQAENTWFTLQAPEIMLSFSGNPGETIEASQINVISNLTLEATFTIPVSATAGSWDVHVDDMVLEDGFTVELLSGIASANLSMTRIYPNPASHHFYVENFTGRLSVLNSKGELMTDALITSDKQAIDVSNLSKGVYFVRLEQEGASKTLKLLIN